MANEVKIKLTADGKQLRQELSLIDKELQELGKGSSRPTQSPSNITPESRERPSNGSNKVDQEVRDKVNSDLLKEMSLVRKELQKLTSNQGNRNGGGGNTPPPTSSGGNSSNNTDTPGSPTFELGKTIGKIGTIASALGVTAKLWGLGKRWQGTSQSSQSMAYQTYGSTLWYDNYGSARKDATGLGANYGYDYEQVMSVGSANMARAGVTGSTEQEQRQNYESDMNAILQTSKAWGINSNYLADTSGFMSSIGVVKGGDQKKFADLLAQSIVDAEMTGRGEEQLQVLESIAENLASRNTTVSNEQINNSLGMYNALVNQNENLKGTRGANIVTSMQDIAASGNSSLDVLAGFGTKYTGISGRLELRKLAEENPEQYWSQVYSGVQQYGLGDDYFKMLLYNNVGSVSQAEEIMSSLPEMAQKTFNPTGTTEGENATAERIQNYNDSAISGAEKFDALKKEAEATLGDAGTGLKGAAGDVFGSMSPGWQAALTGAAGVAPILGAGVAVKKGAGWLGGKVSSIGKTVPEDFGRFVDEVVDTVNSGGNVDEVLSKISKDGKITEDMYKWADEVTDALNGDGEKAAANMDEVIGSGYKKFGKNLAKNTGAKTSWWDDVVRAFTDNSYDAAASLASAGNDVASAASGASKLSKAGKVLGVAGTALEVVSTGIDVHSAIKSGDNREASQELGGGIGALAGGAGGAAGGAAAGAAIGSVVPGLGTAIGGLVGGIVGGIGGGIGGDKLGEAVGEGIYDLSSGSSKYTTEQRDQISQYYNEVSRLYKTQGNNAAQKYTNSVVVPYLNSIGVSKSVTDSYKYDIGKSDFLKDVEKGTFGDIGKSIESVDDNTSAIKENTQVLQNNTNSVLSENSDKSKDKGYNSKSTGSSWSYDRRSPFGWFPHATGNDYVPYDNYTALLHRGEMVLTAAEAKDYRQGSGKNSKSNNNLDININLNGNVNGITPENQNRIIDAVISQISSSDLQNMISKGFIRVQNY